jgi:hypothetical protein
MPVVDIKLNVVLAESTIDAVVTEVTQALGAWLDRTCASVMVSYGSGPLYVNGSPAPAALVEVRIVAELPVEAKRQLCQRLGGIVADRCAVDPGRVFLQVSRVSPDDAWNLTAQGARCVLDRAGEAAASNQRGFRRVAGE